MELSVYSLERVLFVHTFRCHCARDTAVADFFRHGFFLRMGWESTHGGQDGPTLPTAASFFSLYRYCRFYTVVQDFFWWVLARVVCGGAGRKVRRDVSIYSELRRHYCAMFFTQSDALH